MWSFPKQYDVIVIGAGHAGCEAAHAAARMGASTLLLTMNLDTIGKMSCNPAIGGTAKGHIVREIDALGGIMGIVTDQTGIQFRMLNASKGPAVWSPRAQCDKAAYQLAMKQALEGVDNLDISQGMIEELLIENGAIVGVSTQEGIAFRGKTVIISAGTFMRGLLHIGENNFSGGRAGDRASTGLSGQLEKLGFPLGRLKTGTPPRVNRRSIDFSKLEEQPGDPGVRFSFSNPSLPQLPQIPCYITYTSPETQRIIEENLHRSALYSGKIEGTPTRYCPSIEDKVVRFADKERHQVFLEPEGLSTEEIYVNGTSSSLPIDVQVAMIRSIPGLENAQIMRAGYAIEYDYVMSGELLPTLETETSRRALLRRASQRHNGLRRGCRPRTHRRDQCRSQNCRQAPFLPQTLRGLHRCSHRRANHQRAQRTLPDVHKPSRASPPAAPRQCRPAPHSDRLALGLATAEAAKRVEAKQEQITNTLALLEKTFVPIEEKNFSLGQVLRRPDWNYAKLSSHFPEKVPQCDPEVSEQVEISTKYAGYIERTRKEIEQLDHLEEIAIPIDFPFSEIKGFRNETREKLMKFRPTTLGQASRIAGVSPADISVLHVALKRQ